MIQTKPSICSCGDLKFEGNEFCTPCFLALSKKRGTEFNRGLDVFPVKQTEGRKDDGEKVRMELLPVESLEEIAKVLTFGAKKYDAENWRKGISFKRLLGAAFRHLMAYMKGEDKDPESGLSHLSHLGCCVLFLLWYEQKRKQFDDRYVDGV